MEEGEVYMELNLAISLIMTFYNREQYLEEAVKSVLNQTQDNFELILHDDGSTDNSLSIAKNLSKDPRIKLSRFSENLGRRKALIYAHSQVTAPLVAWVDSDDILLPKALQTTCDYLQRHPEVGVVYTNYLDMVGDVLTRGSRTYLQYSPTRLKDRFMTFHFRVIRNSLFNSCGGIGPYEYAIDYDLCLRLSNMTSIKHIEDYLYIYRKHPDTMSFLHKEKQILCASLASRSLK